VRDFERQKEAKRWFTTQRDASHDTDPPLTPQHELARAVAEDLRVLGAKPRDVRRATQMVLAGCSRERLRRVIVLVPPDGETRVEYDVTIEHASLLRLRQAGWKITTLAGLRERHTKEKNDVG
jgi:hypothetical protein